MGSPLFGSKLKQARVDAGFTQKEIYEQLSVPQSTFSSWEIGKSEPDAETLIRLCAIYGIDSFSYFKDEPVPPGQKEKPATNGELERITSIFMELPPDEQQNVVEYVEFRAASRKKKESQ